MINWQISTWVINETIKIISVDCGKDGKDANDGKSNGLKLKEMMMHFMNNFVQINNTIIFCWLYAADVCVKEKGIVL